MYDSIRRAIQTLKKKAARDGLRENEAYSKLKDITLKVITELESRRFNI